MLWTGPFRRVFPGPFTGNSCGLRLALFVASEGLKIQSGWPVGFETDRPNGAGGPSTFPGETSSSTLALGKSFMSTEFFDNARREASRHTARVASHMADSPDEFVKLYQRLCNAFSLLLFAKHENGNGHAAYYLFALIDQFSQIHALVCDDGDSVFSKVDLQAISEVRESLKPVVNVTFSVNENTVNVPDRFFELYERLQNNLDEIDRMTAFRLLRSTLKNSTDGAANRIVPTNSESSSSRETKLVSNRPRRSTNGRPVKYKLSRTQLKAIEERLTSGEDVRSIWKHYEKYIPKEHTFRRKIAHLIPKKKKRH
jgi:hypothetical protein